MEYKQIRVVSGRGREPDQFAHALRGIALDKAGLLYAVGDDAVKVFDRAGKLLNQWPTARPGQCVTVDDDGVVYVGEAGQMEMFDRTGKLITSWADAERFGLVTAIAIYGDDVLLADAQDRCIRRYDRKGNWKNDIGRDNNTKGFLIPNGQVDFVVDAAGVIHAANPAKFRIERYARTGEMLGKFGKFGTRRVEDFQGCCNPTNVTLTKEGHVVVTEKAGPRMKVYDSAGKMLAFVGNEAFDANCKNMDVAADAEGLIYVVDTVRMHICVFAPVKAERDTAHELQDAQKKEAP